MSEPPPSARSRALRALRSTLWGLAVGVVVVLLRVAFREDFAPLFALLFPLGTACLGLVLGLTYESWTRRDDD